MDGANFLVKKTSLDNFREHCKEFSKVINDELLSIGYSNDVEFVLEESLFKKMIYSNINNYLAIYEDGNIKYKGDSFSKHPEYHKNKSGRIINLAILEYYIKGTLPEEFIKNHDNIYDFCMRQKGNISFHHELWDEDNNKEILTKVVRYCITKKGKRLMKIKNENCDTNAAPISNVHASSEDYQPLITYCNDMIKSKPFLGKENIDYYWYIDEAYKVIDKIAKKTFKTRRPSSSTPLQLF